MNKLNAANADAKVKEANAKVNGDANEKVKFNENEVLFIKRLEKVGQILETYGYQKEAVQTLKIGSFQKGVPFTQVWFYKKATYCLAVTQYDGEETNWYRSSDETIEKLLELAADPRLGLPNGAQMLKEVDAELSLKQNWNFVRYAVGPNEFQLKTADGKMKIQSMLLANDGKRLYKIYMTCEEKEDSKDLLLLLSDCFNKTIQ